jgi:hypothetical protein
MPYKSSQHSLSLSLLWRNQPFPGNGFNRDSSASTALVFLSQPSVQNWCQFPQLPTVNYQLKYSVIFSQPSLQSWQSLLIIRSTGLGSSLYSLGTDPTENTAFNSSSIVVGVSTNPLHRNGSLLIHLLHSNGWTPCLFKGLCQAMSLYATIFIHRRSEEQFWQRNMARIKIGTSGRNVSSYVCQSLTQMEKCLRDCYMRTYWWTDGRGEVKRGAILQTIFVNTQTSLRTPKFIACHQSNTALPRVSQGVNL